MTELTKDKDMRTQKQGNIEYLMTGPEGNSEFCFPRNKHRETSRFEGNKIHCFPRDQSLSV